MSADVLLGLEQAVIGAVLCDPKVLGELPSLDPWHFHHVRTQATFEALRNLEAEGRHIDHLTLEAELARMGKMDAVGAVFIAECALNVPIRENAQEYARQIVDASLSRRIRVGLDGVLTEAKQRAIPGPELLSMALAVLSRLDAEQPDEAQTISQLVTRRLADLDKLVDDRERGLTGLTGYPTGSASLDRLIGGWQNGIVSLIAARPGMGKSSLGLATADACTALGLGVHLFSLEDSWHAYADRAMAREGRIPAELIRSTKLTRLHMRNLGDAINRLRQRKRWLVDNRSGITADEVVRSVRRHARDNQTRVVIVDYVQLVKRPRHNSVHEELTQVVEILADAAKHDGVAYVVMSQLNRGLEQRTDKRPQLSDLRETGSLEERAKCVVALYRGAYYGTGPKQGIDYDEHDRPPTPEEFERQVQLITLKNSNGATGRVFATWDGPTLRLE